MFERSYKKGPNPQVHGCAEDHECDRKQSYMKGSYAIAKRTPIHNSRPGRIVYPGPRTVRIIFRGLPSSTLLRRCFKYWSTMFVTPSKLWSHTCSISMLRESTRSSFCIKCSSSEYS